MYGNFYTDGLCNLPGCFQHLPAMVVSDICYGSLFLTASRMFTTSSQILMTSSKIFTTTSKTKKVGEVIGKCLKGNSLPSHQK